MESVGIGLIIICVIGLVALGAYFSHKAKAARRAAMEALAREMNMTFDPSERRDVDRLHSQFELFGRGHTKRAYNTLAGQLEIARRTFGAVMGDYRYSITTSNGKTTTTTTHRVSYIILHTPYPGLPSLFVRPEGFMDKIKSAVGFDDIDFESEEFSRKFYVKSSDKRFAYAVVHPKMMEFLMADRGPVIDIAQGAVCLVKGSREWEPLEFRNNLTYLWQFFDLWPEHLLAELDSRAAPSHPSKDR